MKKPEKFLWKKHLPEHLPKEDLWEKVLTEKSLDSQVTDLKSRLPLAYPKEGLWMGIEKGLNQRKTTVLWSRILTAAAVLLLGLWGAKALLTTPLPRETTYLTTELSAGFGRTTPAVTPIFTPKTNGKTLPVNSTTRQPIEFNPIETIEVREPEEVKHIQIELPLPEIMITEVEPQNEESDNIPDTAYEGKKTIAIKWEAPPKRIKIEGFNVELSEKEIQLLKELENRKTGKFKLHINSLTARLYEK
jgi:hypothetical protein